MLSNRTTANRHPVWRIIICCDESFDSSRIVSNRQNLLHCIVFSILTIDLRSFHALKTWKVHVILFSYHATHFHLLPTRAPLGFRYVNAQFDIRCEDSSTTVDESQRFGCIGHVCQTPPLWNRKERKKFYPNADRVSDVDQLFFATNFSIMFHRSSQYIALHTEFAPQ